MSFDDACRLGHGDEYKGEIYQRQEERWHRSGTYWADPPKPPDATESHLVEFAGLPACTPKQFKALLTEALSLLENKKTEIGKAYWGARGARASAEILRASLNFTIQSQGEEK
tara:strand:- start:504 stop:842 length:339 start_codon:yes stop_codon:yes gene_type:complete